VALWKPLECLSGAANFLDEITGAPEDSTMVARLVGHLIAQAEGALPMATAIDRASEEAALPMTREVAPSSAVSPPRSPRGPAEAGSRQHLTRPANQKSWCQKQEETGCSYREIEPHLSMLYKLIRLRVRDPADVEDVLQETLLHAFSNLDQLRSEDCLRAWLIQIAINEARRVLRAKRRAPFFCSIDQPPGTIGHGDVVIHEIADWHETPTEIVERAELTEMLQQKLATLRPKWRDLLVLCDVQELSVNTAARRMGISLADARSSLYRARFALRELLAPTLGKADPQGAFRI